MLECIVSLMEIMIVQPVLIGPMILANINILAWMVVYMPDS